MLNAEIVERLRALHQIIEDMVTMVEALLDDVERIKAAELYPKQSQDYDLEQTN